MAAVSFYIRTTSKKKNPDTNIRIRFNLGSKPFYAKTPFQIRINDWDHKSKRVKQVLFKDTALKINTYLLNLEAFILNSHINLNNKEVIDSKWLQRQVDLFMSPKIKEEKKEEYFRDFINNLVDNAHKITIKRTAKKLSTNTIKKYNTTRNWLVKFIESYNNDIFIKDIDVDFYDGFYNYLLEEGKAKNTIGKNISILKVFITHANKKGYNIDTSEFIVPREESDSIALNNDEINMLYNADLSDKPHLEIVRDLFVIGCNTGLRFSDFTSIDPDNINEKTLLSRNIKTGNKIHVPLFEQTKAILYKYNNKMPKSPLNQVFNRQIKEVCRLVGIDSNISITITKGGDEITTKHKKWEKISSHTARRSFATNLYKSGVSHIAIMAITGHKTESSFLKYIKVTKEEHAEKLTLLDEKRVAGMVA